MSHFRTETGRKVMFFDIAKAIDTLHPRLRGKHIFEQLSALGLYGEFRRGTTPCGLPYSFTEYLEEVHDYQTEQYAARSICTCSH